ncbi:hypothetical protein [Vallitalea okinawensis]|uniref:hypothetical protein n=1 Tax=Vallitalea okinawensis TaxID=2078660 RepID=UPI000CFCD740|nr:hypothetical protein [Vallitalea okinawensis]
MKTYIDAKGILTRDCMKSQIIYQFFVDKPLNGLYISFYYYPKSTSEQQQKKLICEYYIKEYPDAVQSEYKKEIEKEEYFYNLLTLSIDDDKGFRGSYHKHWMVDEIVIEKESATKGFIAGEIKEGNWKVTISNHAILTENVTYHIKVWGT